jgi:hypothetical protein
MQVAKKGNSNQKNYTFHEIKEIRGKKKPIPEDFEIEEDLIEIHEINETRNNNNYSNNQNYCYQRNIQRFSNNNYQEDPNIMRCENCQREINANNNYECHHNDGNKDTNNDDQTQIKYGYVNAPFLYDDNQVNNGDELISNNEEERIYNLIDKIFDQLNDDNILNDNNLKKTFRELKENDKNEIIEGIKIKIENNEQENRFNNFLNSLE